MSEEKGQRAAGGKVLAGGWRTALPKRFYEQAVVSPAEGGLYAVLLDARPLRCPRGSAFAAPRAVAEAAAAEWEAVVELIDPSDMPVTRAVNSAIEQVAPQREAVIEEIAGYGGSDLVCYRAAAPEALAEREAAAWDGVLDWAAERYGARLAVGIGVAPVTQPAHALMALRAAVADECDIGLAALSDLTALSGSLLLALAVAEGRLTPEEGWSASRVDEEWQAEQWGRDAEAAAAAERRKAAFLAAARLAALLRR